MSKKLFSKVFVLLLVVGLLFAVAPTRQAQAAEMCTTACYVSPGGNDSGYGNFDDPFQTIQKAIDTVADEGTIHLAEGAYKENPIYNASVSKSFYLIGADGGAGSPLAILQGTLTLQNSTQSGKYRIQNLGFKQDSGADSLVIKNLEILEVMNSVFSGDGTVAGRAIQMNSSNGKIVIEDSRFENLYYVGIQGFAGRLDVLRSQFNILKSGVNVQSDGTHLTVMGSEFNVVAQGAGNDTYGVRLTGDDLRLESSIINVNKNGLVADPGIYHAAVVIKAGAGGPFDVKLNTFNGDFVDLSVLADLDAIYTANDWPEGYAIVGNRITLPPPVHNVTLNRYYLTIQAAVADLIAEPTPTTMTDYVITVAAGTYQVGTPIDILQQENKSIVLQPETGAEVTIKDQIRINGGGRSDGAETLTIQGFAFDLTDTTYTDAITTAYVVDGINYNYSHNVTIKNSTFTGDDSFVDVAVKAGASGGHYNYVLEGLTATSMHSLGQLTGVSSITIKDCTVSGGKSGVNLTGSPAVVDNLTYSGIAYGIRTNSNLTIKNSSLTSSGDANNLSDPDTALVLRNDTVKTITIENSDLVNTVSGNFVISNNTNSPAEKVTLVITTGDGSFDTDLLGGLGPVTLVHDIDVDTKQYNFFDTIQGAIDAVTAVDGDVIEVGPGTYAENVVINKPNLTLQSSGTAEETIVLAPTGVGISVLKELGTVTVDGFTVEGWTTAGISQSWTQRAGTTFIVKNNIVNGTGDKVHGNCIQVTGDDSLVEGNVVDGAYYTGTGEYGASGILVYLANNAIVRNNVVTNADIGIAVAGGGAYGQSLMTGALVIDNEVSLSEIGIGVSFDANNTTIKDNFVHDNELGLLEEYNWGYGPTGTVALHNKIVDNTEQALTESFDETTPIPSGHIFMAEANWWGSIAGPGETEINEYVDYAPWCANAECTEFLPGAVTIAPVAPVFCGVTPTSTIDINVAGIPASIPVQGYQLTLHFDPTRTSIASEDDIAQGGFLPVGTGFTILNIDNTNGTVEIASAIMGTATNDSTKPLVKITLTHLGVAGDISLTLTDVLLSSPPETDAQPIPVEVSTTPVVLTLNPVVLNTTRDPDAGYCDLASAVLAADANDVLQLQADITILETVTVDKALTLDLNGKVATYSTIDLSYAITVDGTSAALTVKDTSTEGTGKILVVDADEDGNTDGRGIGVISGSLTLASGTIQAPYAGVYIRPGASMVMDGGTIGGTVDPLYGVAILGTGSSLDINGGAIESTYFTVTGNGTAGFGETTITIDGGSLTSTGSAAIYHPQDGDLTITGGTISGYNGIEMKAGNLVVTGGTILGTGAFSDPLPNDNGSANTGDAILLNGRDAYSGDITVNITGGTITSTNAYALRDYKAADQALKTSAVLVSGGSFTGGTDKQAVTFSEAFVALPRSATTGLMLTGGLYNTDPADPDVFVFVPYGTVYNTTEAMYEIVSISLNVHDFYYNNNNILRGVSTDFYATNFLFSEASSVVVELFSGEEGSYVLQQTNTLKVPTNHPGSVLTSSFDFFGTYISNSWENYRETEFGQTVAPTRVLVTVVLPGGTLTAENTILTGDRTTILPGVNGLVTLQGILAPRAGVPVTLTSGTVVLDTLSTALSDINYGFTGVETLTYTFTTSQARYLNLTADSGKTFLVNRDLTLTPLRLYGGDVDGDNVIGLLDASNFGSDWGSTLDPESNINFDGIVNIQDLALIGGNYGLTSATAYNWWSPLP